MARKKATRKHTTKKRGPKKGSRKGAPTLLGLNSRVNKIENRVELLMGGVGIKHRTPISSRGKASNYSPSEEGTIYED
jgi:hypothetical protein